MNHPLTTQPLAEPPKAGCCQPARSTADQTPGGGGDGGSPKPETRYCSFCGGAYLASSDDPILIRAGDSRVLLSGQPPLVDCRVVAEAKWQEIQALLTEAHDSLKTALRQWEGYSDAAGPPFLREAEHIESEMFKACNATFRRLRPVVKGAL